jgi:hypothetical protein
MAWQATPDVNVGDYTQATHYNKAVGNTYYLQSLADGDHDFDTSTGTGAHRGSYDNPVIRKVSASVFVAEWWDFTDANNPVFRYKVGTTITNCVPSSVTDAGYGAQLYKVTSGEPT